MKKSPARTRKPAAHIPVVIEAAPRGELPEFIPPELATLVSRPPQGDQWLHEIKFDGYRTAARLAGGSVSMLTRHGLDWTAKFALIARDLSSLNTRAAYIDGKVVVLDPSGVSSFRGLQEALSEGRAERMLYFAFDLLHLDGRDLRGLPLIQRKDALKALLAGFAADARFRYSEHHTGQGAELFHHACRLRLEGTVSKRGNAPHRSGRSGDWLKTKCTHRQEFVVGGWRPSTAPGRELGFSSGRLFRRRRTALRQQGRDRFRHSTGSGDRGVRHPSFKGIRQDKEAREVTIERPADREETKA
jgi:bifunctional non-homologous end joining protein LigD